MIATAQSCTGQNRLVADCEACAAACSRVSYVSHSGLIMMIHSAAGTEHMLIT